MKYAEWEKTIVTRLEINICRLYEGESAWSYDKNEESGKLLEWSKFLACFLGHSLAATFATV